MTGLFFALLNDTDGLHDPGRPHQSFLPVKSTSGALIALQNCYDDSVINPIIGGLCAACCRIRNISR